MNAIRKGMSTDKKNPKKRKSSLNSEKMVHINRQLNFWSIILTDQLYYESKVPYLVMDSSK